MIKNFSSSVLLAIVSSLGMGCAQVKSTSKIAVENKDYQIIVSDRFNDYRFDIDFISKSGRDICLDIDQWPSANTYGKHRVFGEIITHLDAKVEVISNTNYYTPKNATVSNDCRASSEAAYLSKCSLRIKAGQRLKSSIPYQYFDKNLSKDDDDSKKLIYKIDAVFCDFF